MNINDIENISLLIGSKSLHFTFLDTSIGTLDISENLSAFLFYGAVCIPLKCEGRSYLKLRFCKGNS